MKAYLTFKTNCVKIGDTLFNIYGVGEEQAVQTDRSIPECDVIAEARTKSWDEALRIWEDNGVSAVEFCAGCNHKVQSKKGGVFCNKLKKVMLTIWNCQSRNEKGK